MESAALARASSTTATVAASTRRNQRSARASRRSRPGRGGAAGAAWRAAEAGIAFMRRVGAGRSLVPEAGGPVGLDLRHQLRRQGHVVQLARLLRAGREG